MTNKSNATYHTPVLRDACIEGLEMRPDGVYIDVTFGGGGHARAIFEQLNESGQLIAFDHDPDALQNAWEAPNFIFVPANFKFMANHLRAMGIKQVDGILADLGVSSHQFDQAERGFSLRFDGDLDMRMNQAGVLTARQIVNTYSEDDLYRLLRSYGEVDGLKRVVDTLIRARQMEEIKTTAQLTALLQPLAPRKKENKFLAQVFQALRIEVNDEMGVLKSFLEQAAQVLSPEGRLVVISYHSLEDRLIKNYMKRGSFDGKIEKDFYGNVLKPFEEINRKPISPSDEEIEVNNRARSAKLRIAKKVDGGK
jgi:16S rRNA (cytosine1402-N4)-methyltransferase